MITLRDYQTDCVNHSIDYITDNYTGKKPELIVAPCGSGKSVIIAETVRRAKEPVIVLHPSRELVIQNRNIYDSLQEDLKGTVFSASCNEKVISEATFATLASIKKVVEKVKQIGAKTLLIDEPHYKFPTASSDSVLTTFVDECGFKNVLGYTATPYCLHNFDLYNESYTRKERSWINKILSNKGHGGVPFFKNIRHAVQPSDINEKYWARLIYQQRDEEVKKLNRKVGYKIVCDLVKAAYIKCERLIREGERKHILVFCATIKDCKRLVEMLNQEHEGVAGYVSCNMQKEERIEVINKFKSGALRIIVSVNILSIGFDYSEIDCIVLTTYTHSLARYVQQVGRGVRPHPNKKDCLILDVCFNTPMYGPIEHFTVKPHEQDGWALFNSKRKLTENFCN